MNMKIMDPVKSISQQPKRYVTKDSGAVFLGPKKRLASVLSDSIVFQLLRWQLGRSNTTLNNRLTRVADSGTATG